MNINPKICIKPKLGYYTYNDKIISYQQCQDLNDKSDYFYFANPYSQECEITNIQTNKCKEIYFQGQSYYCKKCKDPNDLTNSYPAKSFLCNQCKDGYFFSSFADKCLICHIKCQKCTNSYDNCTECAHDGQLTPSCNCVQPNYYLDANYSCQPCESQCQSCEDQKSQCTKCSENRCYPPFCICNPCYYSNSHTENCEKITCHKRCITCVDTPTNCETCAKNRIQSPDCQCEINYIEDGLGNCQMCPQSTYFDGLSQSCKQCSIACSECQETKDKCITCKDQFLLKENSCICQNNNVPFVDKQGHWKCIDHMFMNLEIRFFQKFYSLAFIFEEELQQIDFQIFSVQDILKVYFSQIPQDSYYIFNPQINGKEFSVDIKVLKNISTQEGNVLFLNNQIFVSKSEQYAMSSIYTQSPINFKIGPFIFTEEVLADKYLDQMSEAIDKIDKNLLDLIQKFQFFFYILNTLQPTIIFFLLNLQFPPNLYKFYQMVGLFVFPKIPNYQSYTNQQQYQLFIYKFDKNEVQPANSFQFYGFSDCLIVNIPITLIKLGIILLGLAVCKIQQQVTLIQKHKNTGQILKIKLFQLLNTENEVNLLAITLSVLIQFDSVNQLKFMNRMSVYSSLIILMILLGTLIFNIQQVNQDQESQYSVLFTERLQRRKNIYQRNYFIFQLIKKYSIVITVFALQSFPLYTCSFNGGIFLISSFSTLLLKPYAYNIQRAIKFIGDLTLSIIWFFHIYIIQIEVKLFENNTIDDNLIGKYLQAGNIVIIALLAYNFIYILELIIRIIQFLKDIKKPARQEVKEKNLNKLKITPQLHQQNSHTKKLLEKNNNIRLKCKKNKNSK